MEGCLHRRFPIASLRPSANRTKSSTIADRPSNVRRQTTGRFDRFSRIEYGWSGFGVIMFWSDLIGSYVVELDLVGLDHIR